MVWSLMCYVFTICEFGITLYDLSLDSVTWYRTMLEMSMELFFIVNIAMDYPLVFGKTPAEEKRRTKVSFAMDVMASFPIVFFTAMSASSWLGMPIFLE